METPEDAPIGESYETIVGHLRKDNSYQDEVLACYADADGNIDIEHEIDTQASVGASINGLLACGLAALGQRAVPKWAEEFPEAVN